MPTLITRSNCLAASLRQILIVEQFEPDSVGEVPAARRVAAPPSPSWCRPLPRSPRTPRRRVAAGGPARHGRARLHRRCVDRSVRVPRRARLRQGHSQPLRRVVRPSLNNGHADGVRSKPTSRSCASLATESGVREPAGGEGALVATTDNDHKAHALLCGAGLVAVLIGGLGARVRRDPEWQHRRDQRLLREDRYGRRAAARDRCAGRDVVQGG